MRYSFFSNEQAGAPYSPMRFMEKGIILRTLEASSTDAPHRTVTARTVAPWKKMGKGSMGSPFSFLWASLSERTEY